MTILGSYMERQVVVLITIFSYKLTSLSQRYFWLSQTNHGVFVALLNSINVHTSIASLITTASQIGTTFITVELLVVLISGALLTDRSQAFLSLAFRLKIRMERFSEFVWTQLGSFWQGLDAFNFFNCFQCPNLLFCIPPYILTNMSQPHQTLGNADNNDSKVF